MDDERDEEMAWAARRQADEERLDMLSAWEPREPMVCDDCFWAAWAAINGEPGCAKGHRFPTNEPCDDYSKYEAPFSLHDANPTPPSVAWRNLPDIPF